MRGTITITGYQDGSYVCGFDFEKKVITVYISKLKDKKQEVFSDYNSGNLFGKRVVVTSLEVLNLENRKYNIESPINCSIVGCSSPGWSVEDTYGDYIFDLNHKNYYSELKLIPTDLKIKLKTEPLGLGVDLQIFKHSYFLNKFSDVALFLVDDSGIPICQFQKKKQYFSIFHKTAFNPDIIYAIALIQGVMPIKDYDVNDTETNINFDTEIIENREKENILLPIITNSPDYQKYLNNDFSVFGNLINLYSVTFNNFVNGFLRYLGTLSPEKKENLLRSIEIYTEAKSNPTTIANKLMLICTVVESLKEIVAAPSDSISDVLNSIDGILIRINDQDTNNMIRLLRNGLVHYLDHQIKLKTNPDQKYLTKFQQEFNSSLHDVYTYLTKTLNELYTRLFV